MNDVDEDEGTDEDEIGPGCGILDIGIPNLGHSRLLIIVTSPTLACTMLYASIQPVTIYNLEDMRHVAHMARYGPNNYHHQLATPGGLSGVIRSLYLRHECKSF